jgi:hypothetical protein
MIRTFSRGVKGGFSSHLTLYSAHLSPILGVRGLSERRARVLVSLPAFRQWEAGLRLGVGPPGVRAGLLSEGTEREGYPSRDGYGAATAAGEPLPGRSVTVAARLSARFVRLPGEISERR